MRRRAFSIRYDRILPYIVGLFAFGVLVAYATPPITPYNPGDTLDPGCAPTTFNCYVNISGGPLLKTNGTDNGSQSLLNLVAGTNVTLTDNGSGNVTIAAASGGGGSESTTASNGLTLSGTDVRLGGTLTGNTAIDTGSNSLAVSGSANNSILTVFNSNSSAIAFSASGFIGAAIGSTQNPLQINSNSSGTSTVQQSINIIRSVTGAAAGIGSKISTEIANDNNSGTPIASDLITTWTSATAGSETARFAINLRNSGLTTEKFSIAGSGAIKLSSYGSGTFTGTATRSLQVDASGNVIEGSVGGSGPTLQTNGVANGSQSLLNLVAGTNVTLTDNGTGSVTIAATGGGSTPDLQTVTEAGASTNQAITTSNNDGYNVEDNLGAGVAKMYYESVGGNSGGRVYALSSDGLSEVLLTPTSVDFSGNNGIAEGSIKISNVTAVNRIWQLPDINGTLTEGITDGTTTVHAGTDGTIDISSLLSGVTLQNAFDASIANGDNPIIDAGNNDLYIANANNINLVANTSVALGDADYSTGGMQFFVNNVPGSPDLGSVYAEDHFGGDVYLEINPAGGGYQLGDITGVANNTYFEINDNDQNFVFSKREIFFGNTGESIMLPDSRGADGQVMTMIDNATGDIGWSTPTITVGTSGTTLYSSGLSGTGQGATAQGNNIFFGVDAGNGATSAAYSNFLGVSAGQGAASVSNSNFFGSSAGLNATNATTSNFFGNSAGSGATNAASSNFLGVGAGEDAVSAPNSNFLGSDAGSGATNASNSNFFGDGAGLIATNASNSNFFGSAAGAAALNSSYSNFFGYRVGYSSIGHGPGSNNIIVGTNISLPDSTANAINLGGVLFGTGTQSDAANITPYLTAQSAGKIGIATIPTTYTLEVGNSSVVGIVASFTNSTGSCTINPTTSSVGCSSDETLKKNITPLDSSATLSMTSILDKVISLTPVTYNWNSESDGSQTHTGFIAQSVQQVFPDLVSQDPTTHLLSVNYMGFAPYIVRAVQEMDLQLKGINDVDTSNPLRDELIAWLSNAGNHITRIFTGEVCLTDPDGSSECLNKTQLHQLKQLISQPAPQVPAPIDTTENSSSTDESNDQQSDQISDSTPENSSSTDATDDSDDQSIDQTTDNQQTDEPSDTATQNSSSTPSTDQQVTPDGSTQTPETTDSSSTAQ